MSRKPQGVERRLSTQVVKVDAADMVTVERDDKVWSDRVTYSAKPGAFVRLRPPPGISETTIAALKKGYEALGAHVKVERPTEVAPVPAALHEPKKLEYTKQTAREAALGLVEEANTEDREALRTVVEEFLAVEGL